MQYNFHSFQASQVAEELTTKAMKIAELESELSSKKKEHAQLETSFNELVSQMIIDL